MENKKSEKNLHEYDPGSIWEHLLYGAAGAAVMTVPLFFPEVSTQSWVKWIFGTVIVFYIIVCLLGIWKAVSR